MSQLQKKLYHAIIPAIFTARNPNNTVNIDNSVKAAVKVVELGAGGVYATGSTGEGNNLNLDDRKELLTEIIKAVQVPVIAHVGYTKLTDATILASHAANNGAVAISAITPSNTTWDNLFNYYSELSKTNKPLFIYIFPERTGIDITIDDASKLMNIPNVAGAKLTTYDTPFIAEFKKRHPDKILMYGRDEAFLAGMAMGADGAIGSTYNLFPGLYKKAFNHLQKGNLQEAQKLQQIATAFVYNLNTLCGLNLMLTGQKVAFEYMHKIPMGIEINKPMNNQMANQVKKLVDRLELEDHAKYK